MRAYWFGKIHVQNRVLRIFYFHRAFPLLLQARLEINIDTFPYRPMIIVKLMGGLGNQLFQYATAKKLSLIRKTPLKYDLSFFKTNKNRQYRLNNFRIDTAVASEDEIADIKGTNKRGINKLVSRLKEATEPYYRKRVFIEEVLKPFDSNIFRTPTNLYLDGYWQSEKYFLDIRDVLLGEIRLRYDYEDRTKELLEQIHSSQSVSIHVRRGDYVSNPDAKRVHGICSIEYYLDCIRYIQNNIASPKYFIFSDDPEWAKVNLTFANPGTFIGTSGFRKDYEDLLLMSSCSHNIIANSSFSWWGAWLNTTSDKIILAPKRWFVDTALDPRDVVPESWVKVDND